MKTGQPGEIAPQWSDPKNEHVRRERFDYRGFEMEKQIEKLTKEISAMCGGQNSAVVVGACLNMIQSCMTYGDSKFQRACSETLRSMANIQLQAIGRPKS
jgi:hypothetical protein